MKYLVMCTIWQKENGRWSTSFAAFGKATNDVPLPLYGSGMNSSPISVAMMTMRYAPEQFYLRCSVDVVYLSAALRAKNPPATPAIPKAGISHAWFRL